MAFKYIPLASSDSSISYESITYDADEIRKDIDGFIHGPVAEFTTIYLPKIDALCEHYASRYPRKVPSLPQFVASFPSFLTPGPLWAQAGNFNWITSKSVDSSGTTSTCKDAYLFLVPENTPTGSAGGDNIWCDVQVVARVCGGRETSYADGLLSLCAMAQKVFASQPTRPFLHGLHVQESLVESWVFDRAGMYCGNVFGFRDDFARVLATLASYSLMSDEELGRDFVVRPGDGDGTGRRVALADGGGEERVYRLEEKPIVVRQALFGNGPCCYGAISEADGSRCAVKFSWRWARKSSEKKIFEIVESNKNTTPWGLPSLVDYRELIGTPDLRAGLMFGAQRTLLAGEGQIAGQVVKAPSPDGGILEHTEETGGFFRNRILTCIVTSPLGRPLHSFNSPLELLQALADAIRGHRFLLQSCVILHRDVSEGNIIIVESQGPEAGPKGVLIDFDSAMNLAAERPKAGQVVGTRMFRAIGLLEKMEHTYRHDLESFFYVLLWAVIANRSKSIPEQSRLRRWTEGTSQDAAMRKMADIGDEGFEIILSEFQPEFASLKALARTLRGLLFPLRDGVIWTGTDHSPEDVDSLYDGMIGAFEEAITWELDG
ncbi:FunK1 protein kinase [Xylariomycetidae sp. FL2044]|nr:FunK1 protein kinase [Xylariomycetidae sp. FL2044]